MDICYVAFKVSGNLVGPIYVSPVAVFGCILSKPYRRTLARWISLSFIHANWYVTHDISNWRKPRIRQYWKRYRQSQNIVVVSSLSQLCGRCKAWCFRSDFNKVRSPLGARSALRYTCHSWSGNKGALLGFNNWYNKKQKLCEQIERCFVTWTI